MHPDEQTRDNDKNGASQKSGGARVDHNPAAGKGVGGPDLGQSGSTPGGHYNNTDHGYGTGIKADAGDAPAGDTSYGGRSGEYDAGQRHNDKPDPASPPSGSTPASEEERHGAEHGSESATEGYQSGPAGGEGVFGTNAPFGGGPEPEKADPAAAPEKGGSAATPKK